MEAMRRKIEALEKRIAELEAKNLRPETAGHESPALREAVRRIVECRDTSLLDAFFKRGGRIVRQ